MNTQSPYEPPASQLDETSSTLVGRQYTKVGGWLLFFCIGLTILAPLVTLFSMAVSLKQASQYSGQFPGLMSMTVIDTILSVALMAFSIYAGVGLWTLRSGAVQTAKKYLLCYLGYFAIAAFLPFMAGLPSSAVDAMIPEVAKNTVRGIIYFAIWYSYLNKSVRVRGTYLSS